MVDRMGFDPPDYYKIRDTIESWKNDYDKFLKLFFGKDPIIYKITKRTNDIIRGYWQIKYSDDSGVKTDFIIFKDIRAFVCDDDGTLYWHKIENEEFKKRYKASWSEYWSRMPTGMSIESIDIIKKTLKQRYI